MVDLFVQATIDDEKVEREIAEMYSKGVHPEMIITDEQAKPGKELGEEDDEGTSHSLTTSTIPDKVLLVIYETRAW